VSEWGLAMMVLLVLAAGTIVFKKRQQVDCRMSNSESNVRTVDKT
jgi:hypothetical protein